MREPAFWWTKRGAVARLLSPLGVGYGAITGWRLRQTGRRAGIPVFCIGNFTLGGAGKTPTALAVAEILAAAGERPFFLSRGYGGRLTGPLRVDPASHRAEGVGDEPLLLARAAPTIVSRDRVAGAAMAQDAGASVIVMDDGLQNPSLAKDLTLAVVDSRRGIGNGAVFPAGPLRAPLAAQIARADAMLTIGTGAVAKDVESAFAGRPVFHGRLTPDSDAVAALEGRKALAFAGIGNPDKFFRTLLEAGIRITATQGFPDHHRYTATEAKELIGRADAEGLTPVTTEKDLVRLAGDPDLMILARRARALPVRLVVDESEAFRKFLLAKIGKA
jgi:tetraacyldisaccharide 4'-kinase